ncbi:MAG TPA: HAD family phosphatase [Lentimicrobium sp.]|jgi:putative hydrolase of the HAD superfamily|nr:HAD family phosphatase [Lentimicrobium sp.]
MPVIRSSSPLNADIKLIVFDLGNVLLNINPMLTNKAFRALGIIDENEFFSGKQTLALMSALECGTTGPDDFLREVLKKLKPGVTSTQAEEAWNAMLLDFPAKRVRMLQGLRKSYRIGLLSNTNQVHYRDYTARFARDYGIPFGDLFDYLWFSHEIGIAKPEAGIFEHVLSNSGVRPAEILFIDDTLMHVEAAARLGINAVHLEAGMEVSELLSLF